MKLIFIFILYTVYGALSIESCNIFGYGNINIDKRYRKGCFNVVSARICDGNGILSYLGNMGGIIARSKFRLGDIYEIRLRTGQAIALETVRGRFIVDKIVSSDDISDCMRNFCHYSIHSFEKEMRDGYITLKGGHRAGFCGTAVMRNSVFENIRDISSINIRIAREVIGCGEELRDIVFDDSFRGLLIAGKPMSGKTTVLRDLCRIIGNDFKLAVIDSRGEIAAVYGGVPQNSIGQFTDVLNGYGKCEGIEIATRTLSPEFIACDEITGNPQSAKLCLNSGVKMIFTIHCGSLKQAMESNIASTGAISHIAFLGGKTGQVTKTVTI